METTEEWRPVAGYEDRYEVSNIGRFRSVTRTARTANGSLRTYTGRILAGRPNPRGHLLVQLWRNRVSDQRLLHRLVLEAFVGPCPDGMLGCHYDDDPSNNHISNLRWATRADNSLDATRNGRNRNALKTHCPQGHPYDEQNTKRGSRQAGRQCRTCNAAANPARMRARRLRLKEEAAK